jgi:hypothetical protein
VDYLEGFDRLLDATSREAPDEFIQSLLLLPTLKDEICFLNGQPVPTDRQIAFFNLMRASAQRTVDAAPRTGSRGGGLLNRNRSSWRVLRIMSCTRIGENRSVLMWCASVQLRIFQRQDIEMDWKAAILGVGPFRFSKYALVVENSERMR